MVHTDQGTTTAFGYHRGRKKGHPERIEAMANKEWKDLSARQKGGIVLGSAVQISLLAVALIDIYRRPQEEIRGNKWLWTLVAFINYVGPISYFLFGRRR